VELDAFFFLLTIKYINRIFVSLGNPFESATVRGCASELNVSGESGIAVINQLQQTDCLGS
jgi:hypothetical protein